MMRSALAALAVLGAMLFAPPIASSAPWACTMSAPWVSDEFTVTARFVSGTHTVVIPAIIDTGDGTSASIPAKVARALDMPPPTTGGIFKEPNGSTGYYANLGVVLCGRAFNLPTANVIVGPWWTPLAPDTALLGNVFLVDSHLTLTLDPVKQTVTFAER